MDLQLAARGDFHADRDDLISEGKVTVIFNNPISRRPPLVEVADRLVERLARLEEQMRHVVTAVEKLSNRDAEIDESLRKLSDRFSTSLAAQADSFRESLRKVTETYVSREDWAFWRSLLVAAFLALLAYCWNILIGAPHR